MSVDVSTLAIEVTTKGIKEASDALGSKGLAKSAGNADSKVKSLTDNLSRLMGVMPGVNANANGLSGVMAQIATALTQANTNASQLARGLYQVTAALQGMTTATNQGARALQEKNRHGGVFVTTLKAMGTAVLAYGAFNFARSIIRDADAWQMMQSRLTVATGSLNNAKIAQQEIYEVSQKVRVPLEATAQLYTRLTPTMQRMGKTHEDVKNVVEGVSMAMKLSGTSAAEASSAMLQLSQSFNAGRLNGGEFNSIAEAAPKLLDAIAEKMGIQVGQLKKLGSEGKVTGKIMAEAIAEAKKKWEEEFKNMPVTVDDALTRIKNTWQKAMGELNQNSGLTKGLTESLAIVEGLIPAIRDEMVGAFVSVAKWIGKNKEDLGDVWSQIKGLFGDLWGMVEGIFKFAQGTDEAVSGVKLVGSAIFGVRLLLAAAVDMVKLIGGSFVLVGADIADFFILPIFLAVKTLERFGSGLGWILDKMASLAEAGGFNDVAKALRSGAQSASDFASKADGMAEKLAGITVGARDLAGKWLAGWTSGNTEVNKLLNGSEQVTKELEKQTKLKWDHSTDRKVIPPVPEEDKAAEAKRKKALEDANNELEKQLGLYREQDAALKQLQEYGLDGDKRTALQKDQLKIEYEIIHALNDKVRAIWEDARAKNIAAQEIERMVKVEREWRQVKEESTKSQDAAIAAAQEEAKTLKDKIANYGLAKATVEDYQLVEARNVLLALESNGATAEQISKQQALVTALEEVNNAKQRLGQLEGLDKIEKMLDPKRAEKFGDALAGSMGRAGKAFGSLAKAIEDHSIRQKKMDDTRKELEKYKTTDLEKYKKLSAKATEEEVKGRINGYGDMAGAAKMFFEENSTGYKVMEAAEKTFRLFQMGMQVESFLRESGFIATLTGLFVSAKATETGAEMASVGPHLAAEGAKQGANAITALTSALAAPFPTNIAAYAVVAAMLAALGVAVGGGGSKGGSFDLGKRQKEQNTGTVLGDDTAKSESIINALELVRDNTNIGLTYSASMVMHLRNIDMSIGGLVNAIAGINGFTSGKNLGIATGTQSGGGLLGSGLFGSKTTTDIQDVGLIVQGTISSLMGGGGAMQYADISQTKKSWYGKSSTSTWRQVTEAGADTAAQLGVIFDGISETIIASVAQLGGNAAAAEDVLRNFGISFEVSLKDLKGDELAKALEDAISAASDRMANAAFDALGNFQRVGEGYYETLIRVAYGTEQATDALQRLGVAAIDWRNIQNTSGDVGTEMVRESLMAAEAGTSLNEILRLLDGSMEDLVDSYKVLTKLRNSMQTMGLGEISLSLIRGAGGVGALDDAMSNFFDNFYTDAEKQEMAMSQLRMEFGRLNMAVPPTREAYRSLVESLLAGGEMSAETAGRVLAMSETFNDAMELLEDTGGRDIEGSKDALREAYDREAEALENLRDKMRDFAESLRDFRDSLIMSDMSTKSTMEKYQTALARYEDVSTRARAGDETAIQEFESVANELLQFSRQVNASGSQYTADFERVLRETEALAEFTQGQADQATQSLELLKQQVDALIELDESVKSVADAIRELQIVLAGGTLPVDGSHANGLSNVPYDGYIAELHKGERVLTAAENAEYKIGAYTGNNNEALLVEIKALRDEVRTLKEEQREQTSDLIAANYDANEQNARVVVDGTKQAAEDAAYATQTQIGLN